MSVPILALLGPTLLCVPAAAQDAPLERAWTLYGAWPGSDYGASISTAGDVDGDGFPDLAVGAPYDDADGDNRGRVVVYLAQEGGKGYIGESWSQVGTVDRGHWGGALAGGGDLDGDSFDDLVVAATFQDRRVDVYRGSETGLHDKPSWSFTRGGGAYGWAVALLPDATGNGLAELAIGDALAGDYGEIELYVGADDSFGKEARVLLGDSDHPVGAVLDDAGDVDGDGLSDLVSTPGSEWDEGAGAVFAGGAEGSDLSPTYHLSRPADAPGFGVDAAGAGDMDGDGYAEVVLGADGIGAEGDTEAAGTVLIWQGGASGPGGLATWTWTDDRAGNKLGRSVDGAGDVDQDGFGDLLVGRPGWDDGQNLEGGVLLLIGSAEGPVEDPAWTVGSDEDAADHGNVWIGLGTVLAGIGDADLDGYPDVAMGLPNLGSDSYDDRLGEVWVFTGTSWTPPADEAQDTGDMVEDTGTPVDPGGCGCDGGATGAAGLMGLWLAGLVGLRRRR